MKPKARNRAQLLAIISLALFVTAPNVSAQRREQSRPLASQIVVVPGGTLTVDGLSLVINVQGLPGSVALCGFVTNGMAKAWTELFLHVRWTDSTGVVHAEAGSLHFTNLLPSERRGIGYRDVSMWSTVPTSDVMKKFLNETCIPLVDADSEEAQAVSLLYEIGEYAGQEPPSPFDAKWSTPVSGISTAPTASVTTSPIPLSGQGPFGFQWGMSKDQIVKLVGQEAVKGQKDDVLTLNTAPKPHPAFESYALVLSPDRGLVKVVAAGREIQTNGFGSEVRDAFFEIRDSVSATYGNAKTYDFLQSGSIWNERRDWMMGLLKKERSLIAAWDLKLPNHITNIQLTGNASSTEKGYLLLGYEFEGFSEYISSKKTKAGSVF